MEKKNQKLSKNAKKAQGLAQELSEDVKRAAEAMRRTVRHRKSQIINHDQYIYEQIL